MSCNCSWGKVLWNQYLEICTHGPDLAFAGKASAFVKEQIYVEASHARELRKLYKVYKKEKDSKYTMVTSFAKLFS